MGRYENIIFIGLLIFPLIAFLITIPYIVYNYHKYGSISVIRTIIIYSFVLYLLCAYFLVILPLPTFTEVRALTFPRMQLIPFNFINDFINKSGFVWNNTGTYLMALKSNAFIQPVFNIILTIPFGIYLHYYFKCNILKTIIYSFLLSLFFELTQLSGLYFIYPRSYRLFDVDDLFCNTLGGFVGYYIGNLFNKILPSREEIDASSYEKSKNISGLRRIISLMLDYFIFTILCLIIYLIPVLNILKDNIYIYIIISFIYYTFIPYLFNNATLGERIVNLKLVSSNNKQYFVFMSLFIKNIFISIIPIVIVFNYFNPTNYSFILFLGYLLFSVVSFFKILFNKELFIDNKFKTHLISTLKIND
jgi:glycopeptide antibiotics resistance protein